MTMSRLAALAMSLAIATRSLAAQGAGGGPCAMPVEEYTHSDNTFSSGEGRAIREALARVRTAIAPVTTARAAALRLRTALHSGWEQAFPFWAWSGQDPFRGPVPGFMALSVYAPDAWAGSCGLRPHAEWSSQILVLANSFGAILLPTSDEKSPVARDSAGNFYFEPRITGHVGGFPVYNDLAVLVTNIRRPPFIPVSVERYLRQILVTLRAGLRTTDSIATNAVGGGEESARTLGGVPAEMASMIAGFEAMADSMKTLNPELAAQLRASAARMRADLPKIRATASEAAPKIRSISRTGHDSARAMVPALRARIARLEAKLASLGPAERAAQAWYGGKHPNEWALARPGEEMALPLVTHNPAFFDRRAPRTAIQVLTFFPRRGDGADSLWARQAIRALDLGRVAALLTPR